MRYYLWRVMLFVLVGCGGMCAQGFSISGGLGYAASLGGMQIGRDRIESASGNLLTYQYGSLGSGLEINGAVEYALSSNVAAELGLWYNFGPTIETTERRTNPVQNSVTAHSGTHFGLSPALVVSGDVEGLRPYARLGIVLGFPTYEVVTRELNSLTTETYSGGALFGIRAGLGLSVFVGETSAFAELSIMSGSWSPTRLDETVGAITTTYTLKSRFFSGEQFVRPQPSVPYGNIGVRTGIKVGL